MIRARIAACALAVCACVACGDREPGQAVRAEVPALADCPDDAGWDAALAAARDPEAIDALVSDATARSDGVCAEDWGPHRVLAELAYRRRDLAGARRHAERALDLARRRADPVGVARSANRLGAVATREGDRVTARGHYLEALAAAEAAGRTDLLAFFDNNFAGLLLENGEIALALEHLDRASAGLSALGLDGPALRVDYNRAIVLKNTGSLAAAAEILDRVHDRAEGDDRWRDRIRIARGDLHRSLGEYDDAVAWFARVGGDDPGVADAAALGVGRVRLARGEYADALATLAAVDRDGADGPDRTLARLFAGEALLRSGRRAEAAERLTAVVASTDDGGLPEHRWLARSLLAKAVFDERDRSRNLLEEAIGILEAQADGLDPRRSGLGYLRERVEPYADLAARHAAAGRHDALHALMERAHARSLRAAVETGRPRAPSASVAALRDALAPDEALVSLLIGTDRGAALYVTREGTTSRALPGWDVLRPWVGRYRNALRRPLLVAASRRDPAADLRRDLDAGAALAAALVPPGVGLDDRRRWYVVVDQDLHLLPLAALPDGDGFLGERVEIARLPLAASIPRAASARGPVLLAGDPRFADGSEFSPLPLAGRELSRLAGLWAGVRTTSIRGDAFRRERLDVVDWRSYGTLHFATHALASSTDPRRCAVVLSDAERWSAPEIARLELDDALVVLSACRTGGGEFVPGEGVVGLTWAFLHAGAQAVAASLWSVEDDSTEALMTGFHGALREGHDPVAALARAQRRVAAERPHPAYWAPFVVVLRP